MAYVNMTEVAQLLKNNNDYQYLLNEMSKYSNAGFLSAKRLDIKLDAQMFSPDNIALAQCSRGMEYHLSSNYEIANFILLKMYVIVCMCKIFNNFSDQIVINMQEKNATAVVWQTGLWIEKLQIDGIELDELSIRWVDSGLSINTPKLSNNTIATLINPELIITDQQNKTFPCTTMHLTEFTKSKLIKLIKGDNN